MPAGWKRKGGTESSAQKVRIRFQPSGLRVSVPAGTDVARAARRAGIFVGGVCGGAGTCGRCRVLVVNGRKRREALACALRPDGPVTIEVPAQTVAGAAQILADGVYVQVEPLPNVRAVVEDGHHFLVAGVSRQPIRSPLPGCLGVAFDLGTTTLVASLFDLCSGQRLAVASSLDPQVSLGEDVVSRINLSITDNEAPATLRALLLQEANRLIRQVCAAACVPVGAVCDIVAVGNTFMHHSFLGLPLRTLAEAPYSPATTRERELAASDLGLKTHRLGRAFVPPPVAAFLGSDAVAGALAAGLDRTKHPTLYIDLGTNGELLLAFDGRILGSTTAAGPAFEGAQIECGMRAAEGAISSVHLDNKVGRAKYKLSIETIGGKPALGIAGSGLVDAVAALLDAGALDRRGNLIAGHPFVEQGPAGKQVPLCKRPRRIHISQHDIRNLQLAKAAIAAGTDVLLDNAGITGEEIERVLLAGAFGNYLDRRSAMRIGLLPPVELGQVLGLGNAASTGAGMMLVSTEERKRALELAKRIEYIELAGNDRFRELFVDCLAFP